MTQPIQISPEGARRLLLHRQALTDNPRQTCDSETLLHLIERLGFVQVDSISTVARAHHMILFARNQGYDPAHLTYLLEHERSLFEHWTHDAAIIPTRFFPEWRHRYDRERESLLGQWRKWREQGFEDILDDVLNTIRSEGPAMAKDFSDGRNRKAGGWWDWHHGKTALEYHWRTGALAITARRGFQKVYDVTENVIPTVHHAAEVDPAAFVDWACRSALERLGIASPGEITAFWDHLCIAEASAWCEAGLQREELVEVRVAGENGARPQKAYAFQGIEEVIATLPDLPARIRVISPFDPVVRDRKRLKRLFGFDYRIEIFVPAPKRTYGYYVFPLLEGDRFIGRIDMKRNNEVGTLRVTGLWPEPGIRLGRQRLQRLEAELNRQARFAGVGGVSFANGVLKSG